MTMNYAVRQIGDVTIFDLSGHISPGKTTAARSVLYELVSQQVSSGHDKILVNLRDVTHIDSSGLGDLLHSLTVVQEHSGQLRICSARGRVDDLLRRTHMESLMNIDMDEPTALQAFSSEAPKKSSAA